MPDALSKGSRNLGIDAHEKPVPYQKDSTELHSTPTALPARSVVGRG